MARGNFVAGNIKKASRGTNGRYSPWCAEIIPEEELER
jgi:hypothetical protein